MGSVDAIQPESTTVDYDDLSSIICHYAEWHKADEESIMKPYAYITSQAGKEIRTQMINAFNIWLDVCEDKLKTISRIVRMLHNASLLVDDVENESQIRRGIPVAHKIYGIPQVINTANYVYFQAFQEISELQASSPRCDVHAIVVDELLNLHRGQGLDLLWRDTLTCPSEKEYISMVNNKTGGLFRLSVRLMIANARRNFDVDYIPLVNLLGIFFQIRNDYCNLRSREYATNKGYAEDLTKGKFSFPIVHGVNADRKNHSLLNILQKRPSTPTLKNYAISYLENRTRSLEYTRNVLYKIEKQVRHELARLGGNKSLEAIVDLLTKADGAPDLQAETN
ncbi:uncharacterized protein FIBRA_08685 [Fibroporia radiculosa]|uniref:Uncharacterized protein n=1 Tax=Fibroporia radiculosa TaxID=599839 RepID=J4H5B0_9APHY|nr:uncharacterized protein FIBRA_08685 [Fibroporia radiculosa]CCM06424.1 predicted protein [Fibroporia radiculosa]